MAERLADQRMPMRAWSAKMPIAAVLLSAALVSACGNASDRGPGGVSEGEAGALDEIAEELDKRQIPEGAVPPVDLPAAQQAPDAQAQSGEQPAEDNE